jgi:hypothetical protein
LSSPTWDDLAPGAPRWYRTAGTCHTETNLESVRFNGDQHCSREGERRVSEYDEAPCFRLGPVVYLFDLITPRTTKPEWLGRWEVLRAAR